MLATTGSGRSKRMERACRNNASPPISAMAALRTIIEEQLPAAEAKHMDLAVVGDGVDALVRVWDVELHSLLCILPPRSLGRAK